MVAARVEHRRVVLRVLSAHERLRALSNASVGIARAVALLLSEPSAARAESLAIVLGGAQRSAAALAHALRSARGVA